MDLKTSGQAARLLQSLSLHAYSRLNSRDEGGVGYCQLHRGSGSTAGHLFVGRLVVQSPSTPVCMPNIVGQET